MKTLLAVLSMIPGLTATQPLPPRTVVASKYTDFETTLIEKYADEDTERYSQQYGQGTCYKVNVKNTGEGYIKDIYFTFGGLHSYRSELEDDFSPDCVIAPNQEAVFLVFINHVTDSLDDLGIYADAYSEFTDELTVTGSKAITSLQGNNSYYHVDISFGRRERDRYCYGAVIKAYVDDKEAYFVVNEWDNFVITTNHDKEIKGDENNEVEVAKLIKTEYSAYEQEMSQKDFFNRTNKGCNGSILYGIPAAASLGVITTFVVALRRLGKKKYSK